MNEHAPDPYPTGSERESTRPALILVRPPHTRDCNRMSLEESIRVGVNPSAIAYDYSIRKRPTVPVCGGISPSHFGCGRCRLPIDDEGLWSSAPGACHKVLPTPRWLTITGNGRCARQKPACCTRMPPPALSSPSLSRRSSRTRTGTWSALHRVGLAVYMLLVSAARFVVVRRYWRASASDMRTSMERGVRRGRRVGGRRLGRRRHPAVPGSPARGDPAGIHGRRRHARWRVHCWPHGRRRSSPSCSRRVSSPPFAWPARGMKTI